MTLSAHTPGEDAALAKVGCDVSRRAVGRQCGIVANYAGPAQRGRQGGNRGTGADRFWFADWHVAGEKFASHDEQAYGPILFSQYTLSGGVMKLSAQMPPIGDGDAKTVRLQTKQGDAWRDVAEARIHPEARTAAFRISDWDAAKDTPYRLAYTQKYNDGTSREFEWTGVIRRDPVDEPRAHRGRRIVQRPHGVSECRIRRKHGRLDPDLFAFTGDQFYEIDAAATACSVRRLDAAIVDTLRKWYLHGWTWRELMRDRPSISIPDDHDVYQGNIWGEGGEPRREHAGSGRLRHAARMGQRRASHADFASSRSVRSGSPGKQGISVYYGPLVYGGVSFAILADRQFKSGPEGEVPPTGSRGDHVVDPNFDPKTADLPGLELLGERQMAFLRTWATDLRSAE